MKYGPIICDPLSNEISTGKTVVASKSYRTILQHPDTCPRGKLSAISTATNSPFAVTGNSELFTFVREVIAGPSTYRPYRNTEEMVSDFKQRFCKETRISANVMPLIWLKDIGCGVKELVTTFGKGTIITDHDYMMLDYVFDTYTYLDGSPVGKEVIE